MSGSHRGLRESPDKADQHTCRTKIKTCGPGHHRYQTIGAGLFDGERLQESIINEILVCRTIAGFE
jgi:hypothetical protein